MKNGWTGGQYSVVRAIFGSYLFVQFVMLIPRGRELFSAEGVLPSASPLLALFPNVLSISGRPEVVTLLLVTGAIAAAFFAIGLFDRLAALVAWYVLVCIFGRNPMIANPAIPLAACLLLAHACIPRAPFGSWAARGRTDPRGGWTMPRPVFLAVWSVISLSYSYSGCTQLISPSWVDGSALVGGMLLLQLLYAPLACFRRARPVIWTAMLALHLGSLVLTDFAGFSFGMIVLHLFTFDPGWIPPRTAPREDLVFYDGSCGLCHRSVRFLLAEDSTGIAFRFAPLLGERFTATFDESERGVLPDSVVVRTGSGTTLVRSRAAIYLLHRLGGLWRVMGFVAGFIPPRILDVAYDAVAGIRFRLFDRPSDACPLLPTDLRERFDH